MKWVQKCLKENWYVRIWMDLARVAINHCKCQPTKVQDFRTKIMFSIYSISIRSTLTRRCSSEWNRMIRKLYIDKVINDQSGPANATINNVRYADCRPSENNLSRRIEYESDYELIMHSYNSNTLWNAYCSFSRYWTADFMQFWQKWIEQMQNCKNV